MFSFPCFPQYKDVSLFLIMIGLPFLSSSQSCPNPLNPQVVYDAYENKWESYVFWSMPSADCPITGFNIEYANYNFEPGTGNEQGSQTTSGNTALIPLTPTPLYVYIQTVCEAPCGIGGTGGGSSWVLADVFIAPPPPPPPPDGSGDCSDASPPVAIGTDCVELYNPFYDIYYEDEFNFLFTTNPCTGAVEYIIWNQFISPPTGEITLSGDVEDFGWEGAMYDSFGFVVYTGSCDGEMLTCDSIVSVEDTLNFSIPAGEIFIVGTWFNNIEFENWDESLESVEFSLTICEPEPECMYPTDISVSQITDHTVEISWDENEGTTWALEYGPQGFTPGTGSEVLVDSGSPFLLEGLQPDTEYAFYIQTICAQFGANSANIGPVEFSTFPSMTIEPVPDGHFYCCDDFFLPESAEAEAICDSIYFTHSDSIVGEGCPYTIHRTITAHDTCGNSIQTAFSYDILDNQIPCGCEAETVVPKDEDEIQVALHGDWAVLANGSTNEIYHFEEGAWIPYDTIISTNSNFIHSFDIYGDVIVESNNVYRLTDGIWNLETVLAPSVAGENTTPHIVTIHENTIAYRLNAMIFIFEYAEGEWTEVAYFENSTFKLDLGENVLLSAITFDDNIGRVYRKTNGTWALEQELPNFYPDNNGNGLGRDAAIDGNFAAIGYKYGGGLFTFKYNGESWEPDEFLTNPYQITPGGGYATSFGSAVDIEGDLMVVGDYFNAVNDNFSGSIAVFERSCDQWLAQRNIVPSNGQERQRFGGCLDLQGSRLVVGVDDQYWLGGITYTGIGHYWFYECLESNPIFSISTDNELSAACLADVPPAETSYELGNAWCSSTEVSIESDTVGTGCELIITRVFTATDSLGNTASATQQITIADTEPPVAISAPDDGNFVCSADISIDPPVFIDNCSDSVEMIFVTDTTSDGCNLVIEHTWTATDDCGNSTSVFRTFTVTDGPPEILTTPDNLNLVCGDLWEIEEPTFSDDCTEELEISFTADTVSTSCPVIIQHLWTATDACGNATTSERLITITDEEPPVLNCPEEITVTVSPDSSYYVPNFVEDISFSQHCAEVEVTQTPSPGTMLTAENHEVIVTAFDGCFEEECAVDIIVQISTGIHQEHGAHVRVYPNPTNGILNVKLSKTQNVRVELFDINGKSVMLQHFDGREILLNLNQLPTGMYALQIITPDHRVVEKVIVE